MAPSNDIELDLLICGLNKQILWPDWAELGLGPFLCAGSWLAWF